MCVFCRNLFAVESSTEMLFGAILMTLFMIGWFIFLVDIGNKLSLIFKLYEIAGLITFNNPVILMVALVVRGVDYATENVDPGFDTFVLPACYE